MRREITDEKIRRIFEVFASLWPLETVLHEDLHDRVHLLMGENQVAHDHRVIAHVLKREPGAERHAGLIGTPSSVTVRSVRGYPA